MIRREHHARDQIIRDGVRFVLVLAFLVLDDAALLVEAAALSNVEIVDHNQRNLYAHFAESEHQVGVFSTAMYEGLAFGCKTYIVDLPGCEYMDDVVAKRIEIKVANADELIDALGSSRHASFASDYFFKR